MFPLGGKASVRGHYSPAVAQLLDVGLAGVNHRFDGEHVADFDHVVDFAVRVVENVRFFVEATADAVTAVIANDRVAVIFGIRLNGAADVRETSLRHSGGADAFFHAFLGHLDEILSLFADVADAEHGGAVAVVAIEDCRDVDVHDVAVFQDRVLARNTMADNFVDADASITRIAVVAEVRRDAAVLVCEVGDEFVDFKCVHARFAHFACADESFCSEGACGTDQFDFFFCLDLDSRHLVCPFLFSLEFFLVIFFPIELVEKISENFLVFRVGCQFVYERQESA